MVAFLAALPAIFAAIKSASEVFDLGKTVVEEIKGKASSAQTPDELYQEIEQFDEGLQTAFVTRMKEELSFYETISARLDQQGGKVDAQTLGVLPIKERGRIAFLRMTTRPWAVRWMVVAVVFPPLATVAANLILMTYNVINDAFGFAENSVALIDPGEVMNELYLSMVGWASGVIMTYMGMREIGKAVGHSDTVNLNDMTGALYGLVGHVKKVFR